MILSFVFVGEFDGVVFKINGDFFFEMSLVIFKDI